MPDWLDLIIMALAAWRVASVITSEDGLWDMWKRLRAIMGIKHHDDGSISHIPEKTLAKLFGCLWCISVWVGFITYIAWYFVPIMVWILAISTGAIIVDRLRGN